MEINYPLTIKPSLLTQWVQVLLCLGVFIGTAFFIPYLTELLSVSLHWPLFFVALLFLLRAFYLILDLVMTSYELQQTRLQTNTGIILRNHEYLELFRVKDINIKRPLHLMIFGLANVYIHSSDKTTPIIKLSGVSKFKDKADLLTKLVHEARYSHGVREID